MPRPYRILRNGPNTRSDHTCRGEARLALLTSQRWRGWNAISTPRGIVTDITSWAWAGHAPPLHGLAQLADRQSGPDGERGRRAPRRRSYDGRGGTPVRGGPTTAPTARGGPAGGE